MGFHQKAWPAIKRARQLLHMRAVPSPCCRGGHNLVACSTEDPTLLHCRVCKCKHHEMVCDSATITVKV